VAARNSCRSSCSCRGKSSPRRPARSGLYHDTVFYGWGYMGRIETTALVRDALAIAKQQSLSLEGLERAVSRGTLFLLTHKDQYGVWYSTQATVDAAGFLEQILGRHQGDLQAIRARSFCVRRLFRHFTSGVIVILRKSTGP
jgi:hypothetical protein